jgi:type VI secretion system protein VasJ
MGFENQDILELGTAPISDSSPAGESVRYDPQFEELSAEIAKTESLTEAVIDWDQVTQLAGEILAKKSKDYRVASYMTVGLTHTRGLEGLYQGLLLYQALLQNYWDTAFPEKKRMRGRIGALQWLNDHAAKALAAKGLKPASDDVILELEKTAGEFFQAVSELLSEQAPAFAELQEAVKAIASKVRSRKSAADRAKQDQERRAAAIASGDVGNVEDAQKVTEDCAKKLSKVARFLRGVNPADPLPYKISRHTNWSWLPGPPMNDKGATSIPEVPAETLQKLEQLSGRGEWLALIQEAEAIFSDSRFALDLQRFCAEAMNELGKDYADARQLILMELALLVKRMPEILDMTFQQGSPFAGARTKAWIREEVKPLLSGGGSGGAESDGDTTELQETAEQGQRMVESGNLEQAILLFQEGIQKAPTRRSRFLWNLELAKMCMNAERIKLALPLLKSLDEDVKRYALEEWEPQLSLEVIRNYYDCKRRLSATMPGVPQDDDLLKELFDRLCKLDVTAALTLES